MKKYFMDLKKVGERLKTARKTLKLTMDDMRDISGYSKSLISSAENGLKKPSVVYLFTLLDKFNVNINYILCGEGKMFLEPDQPGKEKKELEQIPLKDLMKTDENLRQLVYMIDRVDMVRYAVLSFFIQYKTENKRMIEELLSEKQHRTEPLPPGTGTSALTADPDADITGETGSPTT